MSDAEQPIPELYRDAAEQVRQLARQARLTDIRDDLSALAAKFERLVSESESEWLYSIVDTLRKGQANLLMRSCTEAM